MIRRSDDPLVEHYKNLVDIIQSLILKRSPVPRFGMFGPKGLTDPEIELLAALLAGGHDIYTQSVQGSTTKK